jgi:hypothetical protein
MHAELQKQNESGWWMDDFCGLYAHVFDTVFSLVPQDLANLLRKFHTFQTWASSQEESVLLVRAIGKKFSLTVGTRSGILVFFNTNIQCLG